MTKKTLKEYCDRLEVWEDWYNRYAKFVPQFIDEAKTKNNWQEWDKDVFYEFFERSNGQCVSSLQQGYFTKEEQEKIKSNWTQISPLLKAIAEDQQNPNWDAYQEIKRKIRQYTTQDRRAATNRIVASLQPNLISTVVNEKDLSDLIKKINTYTFSSVPLEGDWFKRSYNICKLFQQELTPNNPIDIVTYPWQLLEHLKEVNSKLINTETQMEEKKSDKKTPLNQILFGAPETGKTYRLRNEYFPKYTISEKSITPESYFEDIVSGLTWWQVIALSLLEMGTSKVNDILENRWVSKKAILSESKNVRATIWGNLQFHTIIESKTVNYTQRQTPYIFDKTKDKKWELLEAELKEQAPEVYDILDSVNNFKPNPDKEIKHYVFTTFHQSFSYEDFIEGIKPVMEEGKENVTYQIENGIFKDLCLKAQNDPDNRYAIFIDEINRGNVSAIFGELITLIEPDKRIGTDNELKVKLPYSKREFGVPKNVDIYGTMNTADRSVEALDTALRRRFSFVEMQPNPEVLSNSEYQDVDLKKLLETINQRIEVLIDKDHQIGHSYFIGIQNLDDLKLVLKTKLFRF